MPEIRWRDLEVLTVNTAECAVQEAGKKLAR